jgi:hypothetical protein
MKLSKKITKIAHVTREFIISRFTRSDCTCAISSCLINHALTAHKIKSKIVANRNHAFIVCKGHIIDVTVDQFESTYGEVCILDDSNLDERHFWETEIKFDDPDSFMYYQEMAGWPKDQILTYYNDLLSKFDEVLKKAI